MRCDDRCDASHQAQVVIQISLLMRKVVRDQPSGQVSFIKSLIESSMIKILDTVFDNFAKLLFTQNQDVIQTFAA